MLRGAPSARRAFLDAQLTALSRTYFSNLAHYQRALAQYQWAIGTWAKAPVSVLPVSYRPAAK